MEKDIQTLLVTGGLGFIGSHVVERMRNKYKIIVVDYDNSFKANELSAKFRNNGVEVYQKDITEKETWNKLPACDYIFHAAAQVAAELSWKIPDIDFLTNTYGTLLVAEHARKHHANVIYCSTIRVYDPASVEIKIRNEGKVSEDCDTIDISSKLMPPFAISKHFGEQCLRYYSQRYRLRVISHRMSGVVGAGQVGSELHGWLTNIVQCAVKNEKYTIYGEGNQSRDVLHIKDYLDLIEKELEDFSKYSEDGFAIYNVGGGPKNELSINQAIEILEKEYSYKIIIEKGEPRTGEPLNYCSDFSKIERKGWPLNEFKSAKDIISEVVNYYRLEGKE